MVNYPVVWHGIRIVVEWTMNIGDAECFVNAVAVVKWGNFVILCTNNLTMNRKKYDTWGLEIEIPSTGD